MRKLFLVSMLLAAGAGSLHLAASDSPDVVSTSYFRVFPGKYTKDGRSFLFTDGYKSNNGNNLYLVYDEEMQLIKEIETPVIKEPECKYFYQRRRSCYEYLEPSSESRGSILYIDGVSTGLSIEQVQNHVSTPDGRGEIATLPDGVQVVALSFESEEDYGKKYPLNYYREFEGEWYDCWQSYKGVNWGSYGEWGEVEEVVQNLTIYSETIYIIPESGGDSNDYYLTSGIFGDDYHYLMPTYELQSLEEQREAADKPGWITEKTWGTRYVRTGYTVYDSDNKEVMSFKFPAGYTDGYEPHFFQMGENRYFSIPRARDADGNICTLFYRLGKNNSVSFVRAAPSAQVSPRNPKRGEMVSVTLDPAVGYNGAMIQVVSTSGQSMLNTKLPAGQTRFDINTSGFPQGMYIVTVSGNGLTKEAAKIIVR